MILRSQTRFLFPPSNRYKWRVDPVHSQSAIPLDPKFYLDLFKNGTKIGMKMFEQDFLCTMNEVTGLTDMDLTSGSTWMAGMNAAAEATNTTLQWCEWSRNGCGCAACLILWECS